MFVFCSGGGFVVVCWLVGGGGLCGGSILHPLHACRTERPTVSFITSLFVFCSYIQHAICGVWSTRHNNDMVPPLLHYVAQGIMYDIGYVCIDMGIHSCTHTTTSYTRCVLVSLCAYCGVNWWVYCVGPGGGGPGALPHSTPGRDWHGDLDMVNHPPTLQQKIYTRKKEHPPVSQKKLYKPAPTRPHPPTS